jgi:Ser/Thr protein kinase RdoA (MazF antagonist)
MSTAVTRDGADAIKVFTHGSVELLRKLVDLTDQLRAAGVPVPVSNIELHTTAIRLPWIHGRTMREQVGKTGPAQSHIQSAMKLLSSLHQSEVGPAGLCEFDPFRLSDKRLKEPWFRVLASRLQTDALTLRRKLEETPPPKRGLSIIHGDFHAGQLIQEAVSRKWWMIDLDDVAHGHKEADIANFCANLATRKDSSVVAIDTKLSELRAMCGDAYEGGINDGLFEYYAACALLRRALKFAARSETEDRIAAVLQAGLALV